jgi:hypothetical protein
MSLLTGIDQCVWYCGIKLCVLLSRLSLSLLSLQENVNKCCGDQNQRKPRTEILMTINQRSLSHSSQQQNIALTEVTTLSNLNNTGNFAHQIHHHHHSNSNLHPQQHISFGPTKPLSKPRYQVGANCEDVAQV